MATKVYTLSTSSYTKEIDDINRVVYSTNSTSFLCTWGNFTNYVHAPKTSFSFAYLSFSHSDKTALLANPVSRIVLDLEVSASVRVKFISHNLPYDVASVWNFVNDLPYIVTNRSLVITNPVTISNIINFGVFLQCDNSVTVTGYSLRAMVDYFSYTEISSSKVTSPINRIVIPDKLPVRFSWDYFQSAGLPQTYYDLQWGVTGESFSQFKSYATKVASSDHFVDIPANTFPLGDVVWRVRTYHTYNGIDYYEKYWSSYPSNPTWTFAWCVVTDCSPTVTIIRPRAVTTLSTNPLILEWKFEEPTAFEAGTYTQSHYDIQFSYDNGYSWHSHITKAAGTTSELTIPAGFFKSGIICWRVRVYHSDGQAASAWAESKFIVRTNPTTSTVRCDDKPRPTVSWDSAEQTAFQIKFGDYYTGAIFGAATSYKLPIYFEDGIYPVNVRTQISSGVWSPWSAVIYADIKNVVTDEDGAISITAVQDNNSSIIDIFTDDVFVDYIVYRDDVPISQTSNKRFTDIFANGECTYFVRGISPNGYYVQSNSVWLNIQTTCDVVGNLILDESESAINFKWIQLRYSLNVQSRKYSQSEGVNYKYYAGRKKPISVSSSTTTRTGTFDYAFKKRKEALELIALTGKTVIFKDTNGGVIVGTLNQVSSDSGFVFSVSFNITETDFNEEINYVD